MSDQSRVFIGLLRPPKLMGLPIMYAMAFQGFGRTMVDAEGGWRFRTIRPVSYPGRPPHIHLKVRLGSRELLTTQIYVRGEGANARDWLLARLDADARAQLEVDFRSGPDGLSATFPVVVRT